MIDRDVMSELKEFAGTTQMRSIKILLEDRLAQLRQRNDSAEMNDVFKNQGGIRELKSILKILTPIKQERTFDPLI